MDVGVFETYPVSLGLMAAKLTGQLGAGRYAGCLGQLAKGLAGPCCKLKVSLLLGWAGKVAGDDRTITFVLITWSVHFVSSSV